MENSTYKTIGNGKRVIVFVHYFGGDAGSWLWMAKKLQKNHRCILLNLPGFGGTPPLENPSIYGFAQFINHSIADLELEDYTLCGHSMGAKLVLYAAQINTDIKPKRIILIAPSPPTVENMDNEERNRMLRHPNKEEAERTVIGATQKKLRKKRFDYAVESQLRIDENTWDWWLKEGMNNNIADRIRGLTVPTFVIFSKDDPVIDPEAIYEEVLPNLSKPSVTVLSKIGHLIPMEAPRKLARQIKRITRG